MSCSQGFWGRGRRRALLIRQAFGNGLRQGWYIQGGGYAVSRTALDAMSGEGLLGDPYLFLHAPFSEDVVLTLCVYAAGFRARDFNQVGEVFAVVSANVCLPPDILIEKGYAVVHSTKKGHAEMTEHQVREHFRALRGRK